MCMECLASPCDSRCPNAEPSKPRAVYSCDCCGDDIVVGESYVSFPNWYAHEECLKELTTHEWLDLMGLQIQEAW